MKDKILQTIRTIIGPLAFGATFLFFILVVGEYLRRGSVSDFFDLRYVAALVILFWIASAAVADEPRKSRLETALIVVILIFAAYVIIDLCLPFGRLGLLVIFAGAATLFAAARACLKTPPPEI
jgi:hypothetical protein